MGLMLKKKKELQKRLQYKNLELKYKILKSFLGNSRLPLVFKRNIVFKLDALRSRKPSISYLTKFCLETGRSKGVYRFFKLSRASIQGLFVQGYLPLIKKSSW